MTKKLIPTLLMLALVACSPAEDNGTSGTPAADNKAPSVVSTLPPSAPHPGSTITIAADPWCPHNCVAGTTQEGYMVDVVREVFGEAGIAVEYVNISWARALELARQGQLDAVVGALVGDAPDFIFPSIAQGRAQSTFYTLPGDNWQYQGLGSLEELTLLVINNYAYGPELDGYIERFRNNPSRIWELSGLEPLPRAIRLVDQERADALVEDLFVMAFLINDSGTLPRLQEAGRLPSADIFVAFSPRHPQAQAWADLLSTGTRTLRQSGRLAEILAAYGLTDWEPASDQTPSGGQQRYSD